MSGLFIAGYPSASTREHLFVPASTLRGETMLRSLCGLWTVPQQAIFTEARLRNHGLCKQCQSIDHKKRKEPA